MAWSNAYGKGDAACKAWFAKEVGDRANPLVLCDAFVQATDPACASAVKTFLQCAYTCDPFQETGCKAATCDQVKACNPAAVEQVCGATLAAFERDNQVDPNAPPDESAAGKCNEVCQKKATAGCPIDNCALGCSLYAQYPAACQQAEVAAATCELAEASICMPSKECSDLVQSMYKTCNPR